MERKSNVVGYLYNIPYLLRRLFIADDDAPARPGRRGSSAGLNSFAVRETALHVWRAQK